MPGADQPVRRACHYAVVSRHPVTGHVMHHRLVYQVPESEKTVKVIRMRTHSE
jgi:mRNA-degrading endonuclease RelE of RelBE toxin-antitoxin system